MMKTLKTTGLGLLMALTLTSCLEEPKAKKETISTIDEFDTAVDSLIGAGSINPNGILANQTDTRIDTITIQGSLERELLRRKLTVKAVNPLYDASNKLNGYEYVLESLYVERDQNGNVINETATERKLQLTTNAQGYYQFQDVSSPQTIFSWDYVLQLRGFCNSGENDEFKLETRCTDVSVTAGTWGNSNIPSIPVRVLKVRREMIFTDKKTGEVFSSKVAHTFKVAPGVQEISKVVSACSEGLQQFDNQVYYLTRCNNLESL